MAQHNDLGKWGEKLAENYLIKQGFDIIERDWHSGHRDIDIVAIKDSVIHFVEVKTRRVSDYATPSIILPYNKRKNLLLAINHYIKSHVIDLDFQFDLITIIGNQDITPQIDVLEDISLY